MMSLKIAFANDNKICYKHNCFFSPSLLIRGNRESDRQHKSRRQKTRSQFTAINS